MFPVITNIFNQPIELSVSQIEDQGPKLRLTGHWSWQNPVWKALKKEITMLTEQDIAEHIGKHVVNVDRMTKCKQTTRRNCSPQNLWMIVDIYWNKRAFSFRSWVLLHHGSQKTNETWSWRWGFAKTSSNPKDLMKITVYQSMNLSEFFQLLPCHSCLRSRTGRHTVGLGPCKETPHGRDVRGPGETSRTEGQDVLKKPNWCVDLGNPRMYLSLWERFIAPIYSDFGDALRLGFHINFCMNTDFLNVSVFVSRTYVILAVVYSKQLRLHSCSTGHFSCDWRQHANRWRVMTYS